jgi:hypothetical protein
MNKNEPQLRPLLARLTERAQSRLVQKWRHEVFLAALALADRVAPSFRADGDESLSPEDERKVLETLRDYFLWKKGIEALEAATASSSDAASFAALYVGNVLDGLPTLDLLGQTAALGAAIVNLAAMEQTATKGERTRDFDSAQAQEALAKIQADISAEASLA